MHQDVFPVKREAIGVVRDEEMLYYLFPPVLGRLVSSFVSTLLRIDARSLQFTIAAWSFLHSLPLSAD